MFLGSYFGNTLYIKVGGKQPQIWFRKEILANVLSFSERKDAPILRNYFSHHKSSDVWRMEDQHHMDTIPATSTEATPKRKCVICNSHQIR
ncbi:hypothetical protein AVEN_114719-1 [Araneus ventricosus]|uniref:Uncharacterized protein n=1 Tax=Araneus ventricosus TaxID=182803 RepID=A0A4Y2G7Z0_ARAVE|nr:hypothetical protein AVEN_114719-1 [Araneus ventricosus]